MKKIVFLVSSSHVGGAEKVLLEVLGVVHERFHCEICMLADNKQLLDTLRRSKLRITIRTDTAIVDGAGVAAIVERRGAKRPIVVQRLGALLKTLWQIARAMRGKSVRHCLLGADIIYASNQVPFVLAALARIARRTAAAIVWHEHTFQRSTIRQLFADALISASGAEVISVSRATARRHFGFVRDRVTVVHNGFHLPLVRRDNAVRAEIARRTDLNPDFQSLIVMPAVFRFWKGHSIAIRALAQLQEQGMAGFRLLLVGGAVEADPTYWHCEREISRLGMRGYIGMLGHCPDVPTLIGQVADIVLVPSILDDPLPTTIIEALSQNVAIVASDGGGIPEMIEGYQRSRLFAPGDARACAAAVASIDRPNVYGAPQHANGRVIYDSRFSPAQFAGAVLRSFEQIAKRRSDQGDSRSNSAKEGA